MDGRQKPNAAETKPKINLLVCPRVVQICTSTYLSDMRNVPVGSSGTILGSFWFLKMTIKNFGDTFHHNINLLDLSILI